MFTFVLVMTHMFPMQKRQKLNQKKNRLQNNVQITTSTEPLRHTKEDKNIKHTCKLSDDNTKILISIDQLNACVNKTSQPFKECTKTDATNVLEDAKIESNISHKLTTNYLKT